MDNPKRFIIWPEDADNDWIVAKNALKFIKEVCGTIKTFGKPIEIVIREWSPRRTDAQRNTMWLWHTEVASELSLRGNRLWSKEDVHEALFIQRFMPMSDKILIDPATGKELPHRRLRTGEATKKQNSDAMEAYRAWIAEQDITVTDPESPYG